MERGQRKPLRIGHKGADAIVAGNTLESFEAAVEVGVDIIEFDVLRDREGRLVVAHDYEDALLTARPGPRQRCSMRFATTRLTRSSSTAT